MAESKATTPGEPVDAPTATAELEQDIQNDPNLPAGMFARVRSDPQFLEELVDKKRKGEPLYDSDGESETTKPKGEPGEGDGETGDDDGGEGEEGEEGEGKKKKKRRSGYLRAAERAYGERDSLALENKELKRKLAERPAPDPPDTGFGEGKEPKPAAKKVAAKPKEDDYESYTDFMEALSDYTVEEAMAKRDKADKSRATRKENARAESRLDTALTDQATEAKGIHEDWQEVVEQVDEHMSAEGLAWPDSHMVAFATTGRAGEIAYYLGQNLDECEKLVNAKSRDALMLQLGKIEAKIDTESPSDTGANGDPKPKKEVPKPMKKHLGGTATATVKDEEYYADKASPKEYADRELRRMGLVK